MAIDAMKSQEPVKTQRTKKYTCVRVSTHTYTHAFMFTHICMYVYIPILLKFPDLFKITALDLCVNSKI